MLDFRICTFLCVCHHMNYTRAAAELHISQPAVSQHIRHLEQEYQVKLFVYAGKHLRLTPAGQLLRRVASMAYHDDKLLKATLQGQRSSPQVLAIGSLPDAAFLGFSERLAGYLRRHEDVNAHWKIEGSSALYQDLVTGHLDVAIMDRPWTDRDYECQYLREETVVPVCSASASIPERLTVDDLREHQLILEPEQTAVSHILKRQLATKRIGLWDFPKRHEVPVPAVAKALAIHGCGIAFLYERTIQTDLSQGILRLVHMEDLTLRHPFYCIWRKNNEYAPMVWQFYEQLKSTF